ncbi:rhodanese-like domain-containing protein [Pseudomonadota bacterium]
MHRSPLIRGLLHRWMRVRPVFVALAVLLIFACGEEGGGKPISAEELLDRLNAGNVSLVLDVRSAGEFETIHIAGARNIPLYLLEERLAELPGPDEEVVLVDQKGGRSRAARRILLDAGFTNVRILEGHMFQWVLSRHPVGK